MRKHKSVSSWAGIQYYRCDERFEGGMRENGQRPCGSVNHEPSTDDTKTAT